MNENEMVTVTLKWSTLEAAVTCTEALASDKREPERYRDWYHNATVELQALLRRSAVAGSATAPHDHDEQLSHLIDEWGHLGTIMQVLRTLTDDQAKQLLDAARAQCEPAAGSATPEEPN
jgi:hypothetical protein